MTIWYFLSIILLVLGFGFVIFWHELGHFIAAKAVGIKVEQFAVGFGQAIFSWRKGLGLRFGSSGKQFEERVNARAGEMRARNGGSDFQDKGKDSFTALELDAAATDLGISETEYRLNWVPLGGYVKMMGQDDLKPGASVEDPRAFNRKSVPARMLVVSAGVIMNIILAAIGFMILFLMGFNAPPAVVGSVVPGSPAAMAVKVVNNQSVNAPLQVGDRILYLDDKYQHDFTKVPLTVALSQPGVPIPAYVEHVDGKRELLSIVPAKMGKDSSSFLAIGINPASELRGLEAETIAATKQVWGDPSLYSADALAIKPDEVVTKVNGADLQSENGEAGYRNFAAFDKAVQESLGKPVELTLKDNAGATRTIAITPILPSAAFGDDPVNVAGLLPRPAVASVLKDSAAKDKLLPGDVFMAIEQVGGKSISNPTSEELTTALNTAGAADTAVNLTILRDGKEMHLDGIVPNKKLEGTSKKGLGIALRPADDSMVIAGTVEKTPAAATEIPRGATIKSVNGNDVSNWFELVHAISTSPAGAPVKIGAELPGGESKDFAMTISDNDRAEVASVQAITQVQWHERVEPRKTSNPVTAAAWGVTETRDFVLQFYLTLNRMVTGDVSYKNMMGPLGIVHAGAKFAFKGGDWLLWFLSMISANLAVVNFLPIPIVDGGLFLFLIIEKIQGRPLSAKTQSIAQVVGLALILSVFLLVTYQDITRMF